MPRVEWIRLEQALCAWNVEGGLSLKEPCARSHTNRCLGHGRGGAEAMGGGAGKCGRKLLGREIGRAQKQDEKMN